MKKLILSAFVLCFALGSYQSKAQEIDLGIKAGANFANLSDASHVSNKTGLVVGAFVGLKFNKIAIQPELLYSQQGADADFGNFDLDYINVPIMFKYYLIGNFLNIQAGPQFGFVVNDNLPSSSDIGEQIKTKDFDFSGAVGLGLDLPLGLRVSARYNFGLTDVMENGSGKNSVFTVAVGYSFL